MFAGMQWLFIALTVIMLALIIYYMFKKRPQSKLFYITVALITGGEEGPWSPYCVRIESGDPGDLGPVKERLAAVQDEGSQLMLFDFQ